MSHEGSEATDLPAWLSMPVDMAAAGLSHVVHHPLYTLKTFMQKDNTFTWRKFLQQTRTEHLRFLFRGVAVRTVFVMPEKMMKLQAWKYCMKKCKDRGLRNEPSWLLSGCVAGSFTTIINCPSELVMVQAQAGRLRLRDVLERKKKKHGSYLRGIYTGFWPSLSRDIAFNAVFFFLRYWGVDKYEQYYGCTCPDNAKFWIGVAAGCLGGTVACPFDVAKTRCQAKPNEPFFPIIMYNIVKNEGARKLLSGLSTRLMILPSMMSLLVVIQERLEKAALNIFYHNLQHQQVQ
jgi:solute carrier family 25 S-adenosylmethionine transporter 26